MLQWHHGRNGDRKNDVRRERNQFRCVSAQAFAVARAPPSFNCYVAAVGPTEMLQALHERGHSTLRLRIVRRERIQHADAPHLLGLLRTRGERPRHNRAAGKYDEFPSPHGFARAEDYIG